MKRSNHFFDYLRDVTPHDLQTNEILQHLFIVFPATLGAVRPSSRLISHTEVSVEGKLRQSRQRYTHREYRAFSAGQAVNTHKKETKDLIQTYIAKDDDFASTARPFLVGNLGMETCSFDATIYFRRSY